MRRINFDSDAPAAAANPEPVPDPSVIVRDGRLANAVVWVSRGTERWTYPTPESPVSLEMERCMFEPHVFTLQTGQPLSVSARGACSLYFHAVPKRNPEIERKITRGEGSLVVRLPEEEVGARFKCDRHGWMSAWGSVFAHPFHGVTDDRGEAHLRLPPGEFEISVWHEYGKFVAPAPQVVKVIDGGTPEIEFVFEAR